MRPLLLRHGIVVFVLFFLFFFILPIPRPPLRAGGRLDSLAYHAAAQDCVIFVFYLFSDKFCPSSPGWGCDGTAFPPPPPFFVGTFLPHPPLLAMWRGSPGRED